MTERRLQHRFRRRPERLDGALAVLPGMVVFSLSAHVPVPPLTSQAPGADVGLFIAVAVSISVGVALLAYLIRPLLAKLSSIQPTEQGPEEDVHGERWARWEAAGATKSGNGTATALPTQPGDDAVYGSAMTFDLPSDQPGPSSGSTEQTVTFGITETVSTLLDCANDGAMLSGFGLYSDRFFRKFAQESGLSLDEFIRRYQGPDVGPRENRLLVAQMESVATLPDGRISAKVVYRPNGSLPPERYIFSWSPERGRWLIDDIATEA